MIHHIHTNYVKGIEVANYTRGYTKFNVQFYTGYTKIHASSILPHTGKVGT